VNENWGPGPGDKITFKCDAANPFVSCAGGRTITCDDRTDCPSGHVCCGSLSDTGYTEVSCKAKCESQPGLQAVRFCDPSAPKDECADIQKKCQSSGSLPGFYVCRN
jgi:hypothetical protein